MPVSSFSNVTIFCFMCIYACCDKCCSFSDITDKDEWWFSAQQKHCLCVEHPILLDKQRFAQGTIMLTISGPINYIGESGVRNLRVKSKTHLHNYISGSAEIRIKHLYHIGT